MTSWFDDDDQLLEELAVARSEEVAPPPVEMLMVGYDMVFADTLEAALLHDSDIDELAAIRSEEAGARMLSYRVERDDGNNEPLTIDFELVGGRIVGHIDPPQEGVMVLEQPTATPPATVETTPDDLGSFEFPLHHSATFRLRFVGTGLPVTTPWLDGPHQTLI
ncbi:MAG: hypothetical protein AAGA65_23510 [Actinomycetota bacterium]